MFLAGKALQDSCLSGTLREILHQLTHSEQVNWKDDYGTTALQICAARGWKEAVGILIDHGADIEMCNSFGWTPLMHAARNGHSAVVQQLVLAGCNTAALNCYGWDALSLAVPSRDLETLKILIPLAEILRLNEALVVSCQVGCSSSVKLLIDHQANANFQLSSSGVTPLMLAASGGHLSVVEILLSHGANPNIKSSMNFTALDVAIICERGNIKERLVGVTNMRQKSPMLRPPSCNGRLSFASFHKDASSLVSPSKEFCSGSCTSRHHEEEKMLLSPYSLQPPHFVCLSPLVPTHFVSSPSPGVLTPCFEFPSPSFNVQSPYYLQSPCGFRLNPSSPLIPGWMFSMSPSPYHHERPQCLTKESVLKSNKRICRWWRKIKKRCKGKQRGVKVHVSHSGKTIVGQLEALLKDLKLQSLLPALQAHEVDVQSFLALSDGDLRELGISDNAYRAYVLKKIKHLNAA